MPQSTDPESPVNGEGNESERKSDDDREFDEQLEGDEEKLDEQLERDNARLDELLRESAGDEAKPSRISSPTAPRSSGRL
jgi:hypothetical protein